MKNKSIIQTTIVLAISAIVAFAIPSAFADPTYHTGNVWSTDHSEELDNGSIPFAFVTSEIDNLPKATGTTASDLKSDMESAIDAWDSNTDVQMHRDDTTTSYYDNRIGTADLVPGKAAHASILKHWDWGYHGHLLRVTIDFNHDTGDFAWDHDGDSGAAHPDQVRIYNTMLHELGHAIGLCGTYSGDNQSSGNCTTVTTTDSAMSSYPWGNVRSITTSDQTEINSKY
ncbi:MAG: hypothetical protein V3W20_08605 [Candidatus Neomarinimicrobiota bacterium]